VQGERIDLGSLRQILDQAVTEGTSFWSYIALSSVHLSLEKSEQKGVEKLERETLEKLVKASARTFTVNRMKIEKLLEELEGALISLGYEVRRVRAKLVSRGLFGVSTSFGRVAFDIGLSFDPILNAPFIPASTIKGAVRSAYISLGGREEDAKRLFGSPEVGAGLVGFTDAYPVEAGEKGYILYPDVLTPHYRGARTELEAQPVPVTYLCVAPGTSFQFYVYFVPERGERKLKLEAGSDAAAEPKPEKSALGLVDLAVLYALYFGVGAKTSAGYSALRAESYERVGRGNWARGLRG